jgi:protease I
MTTMNGRKILVFVDDTYEDLELWYPKLRLEEEGFSVVVAGPEKGRVYAGKHGYPCKADVAIEEVHEEEFAGLVIPGGFAPDKLRRLPRVLAITRSMHEAGKLVAHICHAGWVPVSARILGGFRCTSTAAIKDDLVNAGAEWVDEPVVIDRNMVSSRRPADLPEFCRGILQVLR